MSETIDERYQRGREVILDIWGPEDGAAILDRWRDLSPDLERQIVEFMFGDLWSRPAPAPDRRIRSLVHVATLTALHRPTQLRTHVIGALRNGAPFKDWLLPASLERIRRKLKGSDDGDRQMVKILSAVLTDGLAAVEAACAEALADGVHSADVVLNILARHRDPGPTATILTPDALRLRHAPIADCARYDRLRRAC